MLIVPYLLPLGTNYWMRGQTVIDQFYFVHHPTAVYNTWMLTVSFSDACFSCIVLCWSRIFSSLKVNNLNGKLDKNIFVKFFPKLLIHVIGLKTIQNLKKPLCQYCLTKYETDNLRNKHNNMIVTGVNCLLCV